MAGVSDGRPRIGIIGTGWWATQWHIPSLVGYEGAELVALCDRDPDQLAAAQAAYDVAHAFGSHEELLAADVVDGVVLTLPHAVHYRVAKDALEAGVHVLVEKPMVIHAAEAWDLVDTASRKDLHLMVGYTGHFHASAQWLRQQIQAGAIGELLHVQTLMATSVEPFYRGDTGGEDIPGGFRVTGPGTRTYADPSLGGGQALTQVTHALGMVTWVTGDRPERVVAFVNRHDLEVDLTDAIAYRFAGGALGVMSSTGSVARQSPKQQEFRYYGTEGIALHDVSAGVATVSPNGADPVTVGPTEQEDATPAPYRTGRGFADLIAGRAENHAPGVPAAHTVELIEAALRSAETGQPVRIDDLVD